MLLLQKKKQRAPSDASSRAGSGDKGATSGWAVELSQPQVVIGSSLELGAEVDTMLTVAKGLGKCIKDDVAAMKAAAAEVLGTDDEAATGDGGAGGDLPPLARRGLRGSTLRVPPMSAQRSGGARRRAGSNDVGPTAVVSGRTLGVQIRVTNGSLEFEDDPFEASLSRNYHLSADEQNQRLEIAIGILERFKAMQVRYLWSVCVCVCCVCACVRVCVCVCVCVCLRV